MPAYCAHLQNQAALWIAIILEQGQFPWQENFLKQLEQQSAVTTMLNTVVPLLKPETKQHVLQHWQNTLILLIKWKTGMAKVLKNFQITELKPAPPGVCVEPMSVPLNITAMRAEAYQQGYAAGTQEVIQKTTTELAQLQQQLTSLLHSLPASVAQQRLDMQQDIADIVLTLIEPFLFNKELQRHHLQQQLNDLLQHINQQQTVLLHLHPHDLAALQQGEIQLQVAGVKGLKIISDERMSPGGFHLKTEHGFFNGSMEQRLEALTLALIQLKKGSGHACLA